MDQRRLLFKTLVFCCVIVLLAKGSYAKLNVFIDANEVSRFLPDLHNSLFLVQNGEVAPMLKRPLLSSLIPSILPKIKDMRFHFNASTQVQYSLSFRSSNESVMEHPRANIPLQGYVPKRTKGFKITFPCRPKSSGEVMLSIDISFSTKSGRLLWGPLHLSLKRSCSSVPDSLQPTIFPENGSVSPPRICNKNCDRKFILRRFCLSDFVIRARVDCEVRKHGRRQVRVNVLKTFKQGKVRINRRQLLERRGTHITCDCGNMKPKRSYLIFGKEDKRRRVLYVDDMTIALRWATNGKDGSLNGKGYVRLHKRKVAEKPCPAKIDP